MHTNFPLKLEKTIFGVGATILAVGYFGNRIKDIINSSEEEDQEQSPYFAGSYFQPQNYARWLVNNRALRKVLWPLCSTVAMGGLSLYGLSKFLAS